MIKKDLKLLITGICSLVIAIIFAVVTIIVLSVQIAGAAEKTNWNKVWSDAEAAVTDMVD